MEFNELPEEVKLPLMAAIGGSIVAAFNHFSDAFKRKSRRADIHVDKIEAEHQLDVGQAELIHRMVDQHLLQENSAFRLMEEEVRENKKTICKLLEERVAMKAELVALHSENRTQKPGLPNWNGSISRSAAANKSAALTQNNKAPPCSSKGLDKKDNENGHIPNIAAPVIAIAALLVIDH